MLPLVVLALVVVVVVAILVLGTRERRPDTRAERRPARPSTDETGRGARATRMPAGADAALWSIVEAVPDPRNHLALTRDLTGEVRIAGTPLDPARRAAPARPAASPAAATPPPTTRPVATPTVSDSGEHLVLPGAPARPRPAISLDSLDQVGTPGDGRDGGGRLDRAS